MKKVVVIVGAGPSGLATSACLNLLSIPNIILEKEDCYASLWKRRSYDRLKLHLAKQFCELPHMPYSSSTATFVPRNEFIQYLDNYVSHFNIKPVYCKYVESAVYDDFAHNWVISTRDTVSGELHEYTARFLVVATGENSEGFIPELVGLESFPGEVLHSRDYKSGSKYKGKNALVVGCGNSGMEIAFDLCNNGAKTSVAIRSPFHVVTKEMVYMAMVLLQYLPVKLVDFVVLTLCKLIYGDLSKYGIIRPSEGPMYLKGKTGRSAVIDVGTIGKIKSGEIQVTKGIERVKGNEVMFTNGNSYQFDVIVFATGYKSSAMKWLKDDDTLLNSDGFPKQSFPNHWKGENGLYCAGLARRGLAGVSMDAQSIAKHIKKVSDSQ